MKVAVGLRRVAAGKRTSGRRAAQIANSMSIIVISCLTLNMNIEPARLLICWPNLLLMGRTLRQLL